jgi:L-iditol 2-dehydrogenase
MDALVVTAPHEFSIEQVAVPAPGDNEVMCRVRSVAICGTDAHIIAGDFPGFWPPSFPLIPGHEWSGEIVETGPRAAELGWAVGDRVAGTSHAPCGYCRACVEGRYNLCENYGRENLHAQYGHNAPGSFATYTVHSVRSVFKIPDELDNDVAAMLDPTAIAMHTARRGGVRPGDVVAVTGAGVMGLLTAECARSLGAGRVLVVGRGVRLQMARKLGHEIIDVSEESPVERVREETDGLGADVALECVGAPEPLQWCLGFLRRGGSVAVVGIPPGEVALGIRALVLDEIDVRGVRASANDLPRVIPLVTSGRVRAGELITHRYPLRDFAEAFRTFIDRVDGALKVIVKP